METLELKEVEAFLRCRLGGGKHSLAQSSNVGEKSMPAQGRKLTQWKWVALVQRYPFDFCQLRSFWKIALMYISRFWVEEDTENREPG